MERAGRDLRDQAGEIGMGNLRDQPGERGTERETLGISLGRGGTLTLKRAGWGPSPLRGGTGATWARAVAERGVGDLMDQPRERGGGP